jgi:hypothetical protein
MLIEREPTAEHLADLRRDLADWLRAHTGWPEGAVDGACRLTTEVTGGTHLEATVEIDGSAVRLHVDRCAESDLSADGHPGRVTVVAHAGEILLRSGV